MSYRVELTDSFKKDAKRLTKKYPSLKRELAELGEELEQNPTLGIALGNDCYKIRIAIASKGKGKSGGGRILTQVKVVHNIVYLFSIFDKSEKENISDKEFQLLISKIL